MSDFKQFADAMNKRLVAMSKNELYVVSEVMSDGTPVDPSLTKDAVWQKYLDSFPEGSNPIYRERTEHDCSSCRQFVKGFGNVVEIVDGQVRSIWASAVINNMASGTYRYVAAAMDEYVRSLPLSGIFRTSERQYGTEVSRGLFGDDVETWNHFWSRVADKHFSTTVGEDRGSFDAAVQVFTRGLNELTPSAIETVIDLINDESLYRGEEHLRAVTEFRSLQNKYQATGAFYRTAGRPFVYANAMNPAARFRNTVIGTLVQDLSSGVSLEQAVRSFESKVAPTNYKRPKALITPAMVNQAMATINELGIEDSLKRRFAKFSDVSVNNVLWADRATQPLMRDGIADLLMGAAVQSRPLAKGAKPEEVSIVQFMKDILPGATSVDLLVRNAHESNFVSLTAGEYETAPLLFKWSNHFGWSYGGNVTDSIREKVKRAGGSVTGKLRVSLSWFNYDDLDLHITEPNGNEIFYANRGNPRRGGVLDVDMNAGGRDSREPVENITWSNVIPNGDYKVVVNQFTPRDTSDFGFVIETESNGVIQNYHYDKRMTHRENVHVATMTVENGVITAFKPGKDISGGSVSKEVWGIKTEQFVPVRTIMYSPNHWDDNAVGNKHWFFILKDCINDQPTRGIYNEFLRSDLDRHRKVFEILGEKTKCVPSDEQLSGVGFSSTAGSSINAKIMSGTRPRLININF